MRSPVATRPARLYSTFASRHNARTLLLAGSAILALWRPALAQQPEEAPLTFRYSGLNSFITALYWQDSTYLPLLDLLTQLRVVHQADIATGVVRGRYPAGDTTFELSFRDGRAIALGARHQLAPHEFILTPLDFYVLPSVLARVFDLHFTVDMRALGLALATQQRLPIVVFAEAGRRAAQLQRLGLFDEPADPLLPRRRHLFQPGLLEYYLAGSQTWPSGGSSGVGLFSFGAEVAGGDVQTALHLIRTGTGTETQLQSTRWRYVLQQDWLTQLYVGDVFTQGLVPGALARGVRVTNEPPRRDVRFGSYRLLETAEPGSIVEVYLSGLLIASTRANPEGVVDVELPIAYGANLIELHVYSPSGDFRQHARRIEAPRELVPVGKLWYDMAAGRSFDRGAGSVTARYGVHRNATLEIGLDRAALVDSVVWVPWANSVFRTEWFHGQIGWAPGHTARVQLDVPIAPQGVVELDGLWHSVGTPLVAADLRSSVAARAFLPVRVARVPATFSSALELRSYPGLELLDGHAELHLDRRQWRPFLGVRLNRLGRPDRSDSRYLVRTGMSGTVPASAIVPAALAHTLVRATVDYDIERRSGLGGSLELSRAILRRGRVAAGLARERDWRFDIRLDWDAPFIRSVTSTSRRAGSSLFGQTVRGGIGFDAQERAAVPTNLPWIGRAAAAFLFYHDVDADGRRDPDEELLRGGTVRFRQAVASRTDGHLMRTEDLAPFEIYSVTVDLTGLGNPLWTPAVPEFSFTAVPNRYTTFEIPVFAGGVVSGRIVVEGSERSAGGMRVLIEGGGRTFSTTAFQEGSFYFMGVPPGSYVLTVDPDQLDRLELHVADPPQITIQNTRSGDIVEGVTIRLSRRPS